MAKLIQGKWLEATRFQTVNYYDGEGEQELLSPILVPASAIVSVEPHGKPDDDVDDLDKRTLVYLTCGRSLILDDHYGFVRQALLG